MNSVKDEEYPLRVSSIFAESVDDGVDAVDDRDFQAIELGEDGDFDGASPGTWLEDPFAVIGIGLAQDGFGVLFGVDGDGIGDYFTHEARTAWVDFSCAFWEMFFSSSGFDKVSNEMCKVFCRLLL